MIFARGQHVLDIRFHLPAQSKIDLPLLAGSATLGLGWGISGFCPGGLIAVLGLGSAESWIFFAALAAGMISVRFAQKRLWP